MPKKCKDVDSTDICRFLVQYCREMKTWGKKVREDIIALERGDRKPGGDPGEPPEPPDWDN